MHMQQGPCGETLVLKLGPRICICICICIPLFLRVSNAHELFRFINFENETSLTMADDKGMAAPFPAPPPFYNHFTKENLTRLRQLRKEAGVAQPEDDHETNTDKKGDSSKPDLDIFSLPSELRYLIPPSPPSTTKIRAFGQEVDLAAPEPTLEQSGIEQLYPSSPSVHLNPQPHLLALTRSLLTTFLGLTGILSQNPEEYEESVTNLQAIMFNIHDLINQYRPHQARESLIMLMEERVLRLRQESRGVQEGREKVAKLLTGLREAGMGGEEHEEHKGRLGEEDEKDGDARTREILRRESRQRAAWAALHELG